jgi:hypothetical protein
MQSNVLSREASKTNIMTSFERLDINPLRCLADNIGIASIIAGNVNRFDNTINNPNGHPIVNSNA